MNCEIFRMQTLILLLTCYCLRNVLGNCTECEDLKDFYSDVGCRPMCQRGVCLTKYSCKNCSLVLTADPNKCSYKSGYYDVGFTLPGSYPSPNGEYMCNYVCIFDYIMERSYWKQSRCRFEKIVPRHLCKEAALLLAQYIFYNNAGVEYYPDTCKIIIHRAQLSQPPGNCTSKNKGACCSFGRELYERGTSVKSHNGGECTCRCPTVMSCKFGK